MVNRIVRRLFNSSFAIIIFIKGYGAKIFHVTVCANAGNKMVSIEVDFI